MYRVLLVDDEYFPREALKMSIPWEKYGCTVCGEAKNGFDGIEKATSLKPDIVLTDINMPFMDGLTMITNLQKSFPEMLFSIVTGYSEFEYAKRGIELGVEHFILKPIDDQELIGTIQNMVEVLDRRNEKKKEYESLKFWAEKNTEENRKRFLGMLLAGDNMEEEQFLFECRQLDVRLEKGGYGVCFLNIDSRTYVHMSQAEWQKKIEEAMGKMEKEWTYRVCYLGRGNLYIIFANLSETDWDMVALSALMQKIQITFMQNWVCTVKVGVGNYGQTFREIVRSRAEAENGVHEPAVSKLITDMLHYIYENYSDPDLSLRRIAEELFVNYSYLSNQFTKEMGMSASQFITRFRVTKAADALRDGGENMIEIACSVGYTDEKYFYRCFKKEFGVTPYQYMDMLRTAREKKEEL